MQASIRRFGFCLLLGIFLPALPIAARNGQAAQKPNELAGVEVLLVRHAERQGEEDLLTPAGVARAEAYPVYFKDLKIDGRPVHLTHIFAEQSERTKNTLLPLSRATKMPMDLRYATKDYAALVDDLKHHSYGKEILICWHHSKMPTLISAFGGDPAALLPGGKWPKNTYDWIIDLQFDASGKLSEKVIHEHLMPGDSK